MPWSKGTKCLGLWSKTGTPGLFKATSGCWFSGHSASVFLQKDLKCFRECHSHVTYGINYQRITEIQQGARNPKNGRREALWGTRGGAAWGTIMRGEMHGPPSPMKVPRGPPWLGQATSRGRASWQNRLTHHLDVQDMWGVLPITAPVNACNPFQPRGWGVLVAKAKLFWRQSLSQN